MPINIPQANPKANYEAHRQEIDAAIRRVLESGWYILGKEVAAFECEFAAYCGVEYAIGVGSGTEALHLALKALGVGPGGEVITVSHTAVATVSAIELAGARPVLVDVHPESYTMAPGALEGALTARTQAILVVHLYGQAADLQPILEVANRHGLPVVEDCAQAHGATYLGRPVGSWGTIACFSFYPTKNLGAIGDGGMVVTRDAALAERVRLLREYGWRERYVSSLSGWNSRLDELQAAILRAKLPHLGAENARRRHLANLYDALLNETHLILPREMPYGQHVYHLYVVRTPHRDALRGYLAQHGIQTGIHYPIPVHLQGAYAALGYGPGSLPITEQIAREILSLPLYPELDEAAVTYVAEAIRAFEREEMSRAR